MGKRKNPKLDNARKVKGIHFIDLDDREYSEILEKRKKKTGKTYGTSHAMQKDGSSECHESDAKQWQ